MRFSQAYANAPLCTNTRVALITGRYQYRLQARARRAVASRQPRRAGDGHSARFSDIAVAVARADYRTALIGKWHLGFLPQYGPLKSGYDEFFGIMGGFTGYYTQAVRAANMTFTKAKCRSSGRDMSPIC